MTRGYPDGARTTPVPDLVFARDLAELGAVDLKVLLTVVWRVHRRPPQSPRAVAEPALVAEPAIARGLPALGVDPEGVAATVASSLDGLVAGGRLLAAMAPSPDGPVRWVMPNDRAGRAEIERWRERALALPDLPAAAGTERPRRGVYDLYEQNIGLLTPLIAEEIEEARATYPEEWIEDAIRQAVVGNARRWSYVRTVLDRWAREGRSDGPDRQGARTRRERDSEGPYGAFVRH